MQGTQASKEFWKQGVRSGVLVYIDRLESWGQKTQQFGIVIPPPPAGIVGSQGHGRTRQPLHPPRVEVRMGWRMGEGQRLSVPVNK